MSEPWIDHQDLIWQSDVDGEDIGKPEFGSIGIYTWRDTKVMVTLNNETNEIIDIAEMSEGA